MNTTRNMSGAKPPVDVEALRGIAVFTARSGLVHDAELVRAAAEELSSRRSRDAAVAELVEAATVLDGRVARDGENVVDRFERIAEMFRKETGFMAPGKDEPAAGYAGKDHEEKRDAAWNAWSKAPFDRLRAALSAYRGGAPE